LKAPASIFPASPVLLAVLLAIVLGGCAPQVQVRDPEAVSRVWSVLHPAPADTERLTARFSLQVETPERTGRLLGQLWGYPAAVVRLDLASGTGASVAMIRETPELWLAYIPSENRAYHNPRARAGLDLFQIPVPFDARQIGSLLAGDLAPIVGERYAGVRDAGDGLIRYEFDRGEVARMDASGDLETLVLTGRGGWTLTCEKAYAAPAFPDRRLFDKYTFSSPRDGRAVIRVKSLESGGEWKSGDLDLTLPQDVQWMRITNKPQYN
jgi:hypothetical protein